MPRTALKALLFAVLATATAGTAARAATLSEHFEHTYPLAAGGTFALDNVNGGGAVRASTTNGEIEVQLAALAPGETARLTSPNGAVTLRLPRDVRASLAARTVNGEIESDLPLTVHGKVGRRNHLEGDLNGGGG